MQANIRSLLDDPELSDVVFEVHERRQEDVDKEGDGEGEGEGEERPRLIHGHRNILSARCRIFRAMFHSGMQEAHSCTVVIREVSYRVFFIMLEYLYTGALTAKVSEEDLMLLTGLAEQYQVQPLKRLCEKRLVRLVDVHNMEQLRAVATQLSLSQLAGTCDALSRMTSTRDHHSFKDDSIM